MVLCLLTAVFLVLAFGIDGLRGAALVLAALALALLGWTVIVYRSSEFAVTDRRVIIKVGWLRRRTVETMLGKSRGCRREPGSPRQDPQFFGTITVTGTGGTMEEFHRIANPLQFRKQIQGQVIAAEERRKSAGPDPEERAGPDSGSDRTGGRECPVLRRANPSGRAKDLPVLGRGDAGGRSGPGRRGVEWLLQAEEEHELAGRSGASGAAVRSRRDSPGGVRVRAGISAMRSACLDSASTQGSMSGCTRLICSPPGTGSTSSCRSFGGVCRRPSSTDSIRPRRRGEPTRKPNACGRHPRSGWGPWS